MTRAQLQAKIKQLKADKLVPMTFDARQSNKILADKIAEVEAANAPAPSTPELQQPTAEEVRNFQSDNADFNEVAANCRKEFYANPPYKPALVKKVLHWTREYTQDNNLEKMTDAVLDAGNTFPADRTAHQQAVMAAYNLIAAKYQESARRWNELTVGL